MIITVRGLPVAQGSKRIGRHGAHPVILDANDRKLKPWREAVKWAALTQDISERGVIVGPRFPTGPVRVVSIFTFPRPKHHYRTGKYAHLLRDNAPHFKTSKPDIEKLERSTFDALTDAGIWRDDAQVVDAHSLKVYGETAGAELRVEGVEVGDVRPAGQVECLACGELIKLVDDRWTHLRSDMTWLDYHIEAVE